jgi:hypothetical protein
MPVRRQPLLAPVVTTLQREDAAVERPQRPRPDRPRVKGARASLEDLVAARAELEDAER